MLWQRRIGSDLEAFFEVVLLAGLRGEIAAVGVLVLLGKGLFGQFHLLGLRQGEEFGC